MTKNFGMREVCDVQFYKYTSNNTDPTTLSFMIDTAKTSTLETAATVVYATGGVGSPRLMAWEGEKTLTFTVEDALLSEASLKALMGDTNTEKQKFSIKSNSFAGTYKIIAKTLVRDENGIDYPATITIHRAKLQSNFSIPMNPSGDPATFSFVFDAFPVNKEFCNIVIDDDEWNKEDLFGTSATNLTLYFSDGTKVTSTTATAIKVAAVATDSTTASLTLEGDTSVTGKTIAKGDIITDLKGTSYPYEGTELNISISGTQTWYIV